LQSSQFWPIPTRTTVQKRTTTAIRPAGHDLSTNQKLCGLQVVPVRFRQNKEVCNTVRSRYKRQLIRLNMNKKWPTRTEMEDLRPIFFCKRFSFNENAL